MKRPVCISGAELCGARMSGIPRYMHEVIVNIDRLLEETDSDMDIRVCYPAGSEIMLPGLRRIKLVAIEKPPGKKWNTDVFKKYVLGENGLFVGMSNNKTLVKGSIITLHDVRRLESNTFDSFKARVLYRFQMLFIKKYAGHIMTITEYQKARICQYLHKKPENVSVSYCGHEHIEEIEADDSILERLHISSGQYYYAVGSIAAHKNYKWILEAAEKNPDKTFVIAGGEMRAKWNTDSSEYKAANIVYAGFVTDGENKALMSNCRAFIHPSLYEGFGIPPLEALSLGRPVFVSTSTCLPEIYEGLATMIDPHTVDVDFDNVFMPDENTLNKALEKYSWKNAATRWIELLNRVNN